MPCDAQQKGRWVLAVGGIGALALGSRLVGIEFGLPGLFVYDEPLSVNHAVRFGTGSLHPPDLLYPTGYKYLLTVGYGFFYVLGRIVGWFSSVDTFKQLWFADPTPFFVIGRSVSALAGACSCVLLVVLGRQLGMSRFWSAASGAALAAGAGVHHVYSQIAKPDMLAACLMLAALSTACAAMRNDRSWRWAATGILAGLSAATKYNALLLIPALVLMLIWEAGRRRAEDPSPMQARLKWLGFRCGILGLAALVAFLIACPYAVLDHAMFVRDWKFLQQNHSLTARWLSIPSGLVHYLRLFLTDGQEGIGAVLTVLGLAGFLLAIPLSLLRDRSSQAARLLVVFCGLYVAFFASRTGRHPVGQYLLPVTAVWTLLGAYAIARVHRGLHGTKPKLANGVAAILLIAGVAGPVRQAILLDLDTYIEDPRVSAARWCEAHLPPGAKIFIEGDGIRFPRPTADSFQREREYMAERFETLGLPPPDYRPERLAAVANAPEPKFDLGYYWLPPRFLSEARAGQIDSFSPFMLPIDPVRTNLDYWLKRGYRHFVLRSDQIEGRLRQEGAEDYPTLSAFYRNLTSRGRVAARFAPAYRVRRAPAVMIYHLPDRVD